MSILDMIGNTPLMNIDNVYFKLEMFNPSGSIKDRIAKEMLQNLKPGTRVVEATSGNTGVSFAMVSAALKLRCTLYCPNSTSRMKRKLMKAYGASVHDAQWVFPGSGARYNGKMNFLNNLHDCMEAAKRNKNAVYLDQFSNPLNVKAQENMARELYNDLRINVFEVEKYFDAIVAGVGTGGTLMGLHNVFPEADIYMVVTDGKPNIEGICDNVDTPLIPITLKPNIISVTYYEAVNVARDLATHHGIHCGVSSGANYYAAKLISPRYKRVLTVFADSGDRYL